MQQHAGWIFNLDSAASLERYIEDGVYATKIKPPSKRSWSTAYLGTLADYGSMEPGQRIYFFIKRKIYGIGELVNILNAGACAFDNFFRASLPCSYSEFANRDDSFYEKNLLYFEKGIWDQQIEKDKHGRYFQQRWLCTFKPSHCFYQDGVDMDGLLKTDKTHKGFRSLRTFSGLTFIKLPPYENLLFQEFISKNCSDQLQRHTNFQQIHDSINSRYSLPNKLGINALLGSKVPQSELAQSEMLLEAYLLHQLAKKHSTVTDVFGSWDYFSHQVTASPYKPVEYMDRMDIWGYSQTGEPLQSPQRHLLIELKKDIATTQDLEQTMKYISWLKWEYGDHIEVRAFLVANKFEGLSPSSSVSYVRYHVDGDDINFQRLD